MNVENKPSNKYSLNNIQQEKFLAFSCPDIDPHSSLLTMRNCQGCKYIHGDQIYQSAIMWVCDLPNREAQRRHHANLTDKQKVLY